MPMATNATHKVQIEVMPLFAGHLPYPKIKVLKYLPHTAAVAIQPDPGKAHCPSFYLRFCFFSLSLFSGIAALQMILLSPLFTACHKNGSGVAAKLVFCWTLNMCGNSFSQNKSDVSKISTKCSLQVFV